MISAYGDSLKAFLNLPKMLFIILVVEFLFILHNKMQQSVRYQLLQNEYGMSEIDVAALEAFTQTTEMIFKTLGAPLIDVYGARRVAVISMAASAILYVIFSVGRSRLSVIIFLALPAEALVQTALFTICIKDLTTTRTRPISFALSTNLINLGVVGSLALVELLRPFDLKLDDDLTFSGLRLNVVAATALVYIELTLIFFFVHDCRVIELPEHAAKTPALSVSAEGSALAAEASMPIESPATPTTTPSTRRLLYFDSDSEPRVLPSPLKRMPSNAWYAYLTALRSPRSTRQLALHVIEREEQQVAAHAPSAPLPDTPTHAESASLPADKPRHVLETEEELTAARGAHILGRGPGYIVVRKTAPCVVPKALDALRGWGQLMKTDAFWRLAPYEAFMVGARNQWVQMSTLMVVYLTRAFGESTPAYAIRAINPAILMWSPAILAPCVAHLDTFSALLPALYIFSASSFLMSFTPSVASAVVWMILSGVGESVWAPRSRAWMVEQAPSGQEAVFLTLVNFVPYVPKVTIQIVNGWINHAFLPNCRSCRDSIGHFCSELAHGAPFTQPSCVSRNDEHCGELDVSLLADGVCPSTCEQCPGWEAQPRVMFLLVLLMSLSSPVLITLTLPILRGQKRWSDLLPSSWSKSRSSDLI